MFFGDAFSGLARAKTALTQASAAIKRIFLSVNSAQTAREAHIEFGHIWQMSAGRRKKKELGPLSLRCRQSRVRSFQPQAIFFAKKQKKERLLQLQRDHEKPSVLVGNVRRRRRGRRRRRRVFVAEAKLPPPPFSCLSLYALHKAHASQACCFAASSSVNGIPGPKSWGKSCRVGGSCSHSLCE